MKFALFLTILLLFAGCSAEQAEKWAFRKTMEFQLLAECGEEDKVCIEAVEEQLDDCMAQSDWRRYVDNAEDPAELRRFADAFFPCFKDASGNSIFNTS